MPFPKLLIALVVVVWLPLGAAADTANRIQNPGFEIGQAPMPTGWFYDAVKVGDKGSVHLDGLSRAEGKRALRLAPNGKNTGPDLLGIARIIGSPKDFPGGRVTFSGQLRARGGAVAKLSVFALGDGVDPSAIVLRQSDSDWARAQGDFVLPTTAKPFQIVLICVAEGVSGSAWFDDLEAAAEPVSSASSRPISPSTPQALPAPNTSPRGQSALAVKTADSSALPDARKILTYFCSLAGKADRRLVTGQFIGHGDYLSFNEIEQIHNRSGQWVGMISNDYGLSHTTSIKGNAVLIPYWKAGGLVMVSHHGLNPRTMAFASVTNRDLSVEDVLNPSTTAGKNWLADMQKVAEGLQELQKEGVIVLWRPYHEMNKDYFWWGKRDIEWFKRLWRRQFDLFTNTYGLHNLLWVYAPYQADDAAAYYPGDDVVDLVGMDAYETKLEKIRGYDAMIALGKPFGFTEFGPAGALIPLVPIPIIDKNTDYVAQLAYIKTHFPKAVFLHAWAGGWGFQKQKNMEIFMTDPWLVNRDQLSWKTSP